MATLRLQGEGGYHPRKQTSNPRHPSVDFYHSPVAVWVNSAPQPKRWGPRAHRGKMHGEPVFYIAWCCQPDPDPAGRRIRIWWMMDAGAGAGAGAGDDDGDIIIFFHCDCNTHAFQTRCIPKFQVSIRVKLIDRQLPAFAMHGIQWRTLVF